MIAPLALQPAPAATPDRTPRSTAPGRRPTARFAAALALPFLAGCQEVPLDRADSLQSYASLAPSNGLVTRSLVFVDKPAVQAARRVAILPTTFSARAAGIVAAATDRTLIANALDRSLCSNLSATFTLVDPKEQPDLTVRAVVSRLDLTNPVAAGMSKGLSIVPMITGVPAVVPRIPYGRGSLTVEAEAVDAGRHQRAGMVWAKGADMLASNAAVSDIGDAYADAGAFADDFAQLLATGETPFGHLPPFPTKERIKLALGVSPKYSACDAFGRGPGLKAVPGSILGLPPDVIDAGPETASAR